MLVNRGETHNQVNTRLVPVGRQELLDEFRSDPEGIFQRADEYEIPHDQFIRAYSPPTQEFPGSAVDFLLFNEGIRMVNTFDLPSTRVRDLPEIDPVGGVTDPMGKAVVAFLDESYNRTLHTGIRAANVSSLTAGGAWRPYFDEMPERTPDIAPGFNFLDITAFTRSISEEDYRIPEWKNRKSEQVLQEIAEGTEPKLFEITRNVRTARMRNYRGGIEMTDSFMNDNQTRAADITNAVEEIGIGHRIELLTQAGKQIKDNLPSGNVYDAKGAILGSTDPAAGTLIYPHWITFLKQFRSAYAANVTVGLPDAITALELMSMQGTQMGQSGGSITYGQWAMVPNTNIRNLNGDNAAMSYGYIDDETGTGFEENHLYSWQRDRGIIYVQQTGMDQDEMERVPGPRKVRRWLGTKSTMAVRDPEAIRDIDFGA